ncbi:protein of unknown function (DUF2431) domain containing protein [Rhypophila sp. PSN 637]
MGKKGGGRLHQAQKAAKQSLQQGKKQKSQGPAAKRYKVGDGGGGIPKQQPNKQAKKKAPQPKQHTEPVIPFSPEESILLIGEGDLSFAASLAAHHGCANLTATVLERNIDELAEKYPHVHANISKICPPSNNNNNNNNNHNNKILYNIDARKFAPFVRKPGGVGSPTIGLMDRIIFNFPHVGGKSTDVNRQVRYNQEMLVDFFKRAEVSLSPGGSIIVTLFEGEPYTLWNVRDLARHSGLQVERSFKFQAGAYPGYSHVRTLGVLRDKKSGEITGGGWKGEERSARSYVFVRKDDRYRPPRGGQQPVRRKRKRGAGDGEDGSSSDEEDEEYSGDDVEEEEEDDDGEEDDFAGESK